jgi:putative endopeptidase
LFTLSAPVMAQSTPPAAPATTGWGVDISARDLSVKPGDDFDAYANGTWKKTHTIPADRPSTGTFYDLSETVQAQVRDIITAAPKDGQIGALYNSFMDEARLEQVGIKPLQADLAQVRALPDKSAFARFMGLTQARFGITLVGSYVGPDTANADLNVLYLDQSGLGLPDRDYYLNDQFKPQREAYRAYIQRVLTAIGQPNPAGATATIMAFETEIAKIHWDQAAERDVPRTNNPMSSAQLAAYAPGLDWKAWFNGIGVGPQQRMIVGPNTAIKALAKLYAETPLATLKLWQAFHVAEQASPYLNKAMVDSRFDYVKTLAGVSENRPRWKRGIDLVNGSLGELVGQAYVARHFTPDAKAKMEVLVANLKTAMAHRIETNSWMSPPTKQAALTKLSKMDVMVGYPDVWRNYAGLTVTPGDLYGNVQRATAFNQAYAMEDLGKPVNRKKWGMTPQTVNAYNGGGENKIVFPAGILQPPFFDPKADDSVNYGSIGAIIGHEISHGFDDQGRRIDDTGAVRDWWTAEDGKRFEAEAKVFGEEYGRFEAAPGAFIKPDVTMGENIADFAGVQVALDAYHTALGARRPRCSTG